MINNLEQIERQASRFYSIRYVNDRWWVYRGTVAILSYVDGTEALAALRELQQPNMELVR